MLVAVLVAIGLAGSSGSSSRHETTRAASSSSEPATPVGLIAKRVERVRDLKFRHVPKVRHVTAAVAAREGLADFDKSYPARRRHADEALLELLNAVPPRTDLRRDISSIYRDQVGGYYDPRTKELAIVKGAAGEGALGDITISHELNHALEDQRFGLEDEENSAALDDAAMAHTGLIEGTATSVMYAYAQRFLDPGKALGDLLPATLQASGAEKLPKFLQDQLMWPYEGGLAFVNRLYDRLHNWTLVNYALKQRRPSTTEQVMHPEKYLADERPLPVPEPPSPGPGWRAVERGTVGEFDTRELFRIADASDADDAAAGWGGGRYTLWAKGPQHALTLSWRWDTPRDARQAAAALGAYRRFAARRGPVAMAIRGTSAALGFAPTDTLAQSMADASVAPGR